MAEDKAPNFTTTEPPPDADGEPKKRRGRPRGSSVTRIESVLRENITMIGLAIAQADAVAGVIIIDGAPRFASAWAEVAKVNPQVKQALEKMISGGTYMNAGIATAAIALPIATHYQLLPRGWYNPFGKVAETYEGLADQGMTAADILKAKAEAEAQFNSMRDAAMSGANGGG